MPPIGRVLVTKRLNDAGRMRRHGREAGRRWLVVVVVAWLMGGTAWHAQSPPRLSIVIVVDGLRPDQVTADQMPRLHALAGRGVRFTAHHAVFPTVTRVNAATFVTGVLPARHGLLGNSIYIPSVDPVRPIDTADHEALLKVAAVDGQLLTAPTIGQMLERAGKRFLVVSSGSSGSALLLSPTPDAGTILHTEFARPEAWHDKAVAMLGPDAGGRSCPTPRATATPRTCCCGSACPRSGPTSCSCGTATPIPLPTPAASTPPRPAPRSPRWTGRSAGSKTGCGLRAGSTPPTSW